MCDVVVRMCISTTKTDKKRSFGFLTLYRSEPILLKQPVVFTCMYYEGQELQRASRKENQASIKGQEHNDALFPSSSKLLGCLSETKPRAVLKSI